MAIEKLVSFESGSIMEVSSYNGASISTSRYRTGARSLMININNTLDLAYFAIFSVTPRSEYFAQTAMYISGTNNTNVAYRIFGMRASTGEHMAFLRQDTNSLFLRAYLGDGTLVGDIGLLPSNTWFILQLHLKLHSTNGIYQVKFDGDLVVDYSGNTIRTTGTDIANVFVANNANNCYFDDIIIHNTLGSRNNSWPNGARLYRLVPNGAGSYTEWNPVGGSNWDCLDEVPPSLTDYVRPTAAGQTDTYQIMNLPSEVEQVSGVVLEYWGETVGSPAVNTIRPVIRLGNTDYVGEVINLPPVFSPTQVAYDQAPDGSAWTVEKVNDMQVGQRSASV